MIALLQSKWMAVVVGVISYVATTFLLWKQPETPDVPPKEPPLGTPEASWNFRNPDLDQLLVELGERKQALDTREKELKELATRLQVERQELARTAESVNQMQRQFDQDVLRIRSEESANLKKLAKVYAAMTPDGAAAVMKELDETQLVRVLALMKENETAPILEAMTKKAPAEAKRVALISERLRLVMFREPSGTSKQP